MLRGWEDGRARGTAVCFRMPRSVCAQIVLVSSAIATPEEVARVPCPTQVARWGRQVKVVEKPGAEWNPGFEGRSLWGLRLGWIRARRTRRH